jgi:hypothetical protein
MKIVTFVSAWDLLSIAFEVLHTECWVLLSVEDVLQHWEMQSVSFNNRVPLEWDFVQFTKLSFFVQTVHADLLSIGIVVQVCPFTQAIIMQTTNVMSLFILFAWVGPISLNNWAVIFSRENFYFLILIFRKSEYDLNFKKSINVTFDIILN